MNSSRPTLNHIMPGLLCQPEVQATVTVAAVIRSIKPKGTGKGFGDRLKHVLGSGSRG